MSTIGYLRVSTEEQAKSGLSLASQKSDIQRWFNRQATNGAGLEWAIDSGFSARNLDRPALQKALTQLADKSSNSPNVLVVAKLDRLSRSLSDFAATMTLAKKQNWALVALDLGVDTTTPAGELVANVMASVAQWERRVIGARTSDALKARKEKGLPIGRPRLVTKEQLSLLQSLAGEGKSLAEIARQLNESRIPTVTGKGQWTGFTVARMLKASNN